MPDSSAFATWSPNRACGAGGAPGTLLFEGVWKGPVLVGTAYVFGCGPVPYQVSGGHDANGVLVLRGLAPVVAIWPFCGVIGWEWTGNSTLVFDLPPLPRHAAVPPAPSEPPWSAPEPATALAPDTCSDEGVQTDAGARTDVRLRDAGRRTLTERT